MKIWKKCIANVLCFMMLLSSSAMALEIADVQGYSQEVANELLASNGEKTYWTKTFCLSQPGGEMIRTDKVLLDRADWNDVSKTYTAVVLETPTSFREDYLSTEFALNTTTTSNIDCKKNFSVPATPQGTIVLQNFSMPDIVLDGGVQDVVTVAVSCGDRTPEGTYTVTITNDVTGKSVVFSELPSGPFHASVCALVAGEAEDVNRGVLSDTYTISISASTFLPEVYTQVMVAKRDNLDGQQLLEQVFGENVPWGWQGADGHLYYTEHTEGLENFRVFQHYYDYFSDVPQNAWYGQAVKTCYEFLLDMPWETETFQPNQSLTYYELFAYASRVHDIYKNVLISSRENFGYDAMILGLVNSEQQAMQIQNEPVTRLEFVKGICKALPESLWTEQVPGAVLTDTEDEMAQKLCRAGVLSAGAFRPNDPITRAEAACIVARMIDPQQRIGA